MESRWFDDRTLAALLRNKRLRSFLEHHRMHIYSGRYLETLVTKDHTVMSALSNVCDSTVGTTYKVDSIGDGVYGMQSKDLLAVGTEPDHSNQKKFVRGVKGVVVVERGECRAKPRAMAMNLACSARESGKPYGSLLVCMFLLVAKQKGEPEVVLETAHGYDNLPAMCLYQRFGFVENANLLTPGDPFFSVRRHVPMIADLRAITAKNILDVLERKAVLYDGLSLCDLWDTAKRTKNPRDVRLFEAAARSSKSAYMKQANARIATDNDDGVPLDARRRNTLRKRPASGRVAAPVAKRTRRNART
jgi:ribosomal protein S18 acetylase RimI-like enzyme